MLYSHPYQVSVARRLFDRVYMKGRRLQMWAELTRRPWRLLDLNDVASLLKVEGRFSGGMQVVPIDDIQGSVSRSRDFDRRFRPIQKHTRQRWVDIAAARLADINLPMVELVQMGNFYYVTDGHHRISVAKAFGAVDIEAVVTIWQTARLVLPPVSTYCENEPPCIWEQAA